MDVKSINIGIITTGSEVVSGQIPNENARWLSEQLTSSGFNVSYQLTCSDRDGDILGSLQFLRNHCDSIVVTGGLGPTTDDLTRNSISEFYDDTLHYSEEAWEKLIRYVGRPEKEISATNKRQCFFPSRSFIIPNLNGTADGFFMSGELNCFVLPGPPQENQEMFRDFVLPKLMQIYEIKMPTRLNWTVIDIPESDLGELCELTFEGLNVDIAYRSSFPLIELKFTMETERYAAIQSVFADLRTKLGEKLISSDSKYSPVRALTNQLNNFLDVQIIDLFSHGDISQKFTEELKKQPAESDSISLLTQIEKHQTDFEFVQEAYAQLSDTSLLILFAPGENENQISLLLKSETLNHTHVIELPQRIRRRSSKLRQNYLIQRSFIHFEKQLSQSLEAEKSDQKL